MSETFTNILTIIGQQKKAQAEASGNALNITTFEVGDSNGNYYDPSENQTALVNVKYTGNFLAGTQSQIIVNPSAANEVLYKCFIPADVGGFTIRELGLFDADGDLILICKLPVQDKFALSSGLYQPLTFTPKIIYTNPQIQAVLTPISQTVPTISEVTNMVQEGISESLADINYNAPIKNVGDNISLDFDDTLKLSSGKLSVAKVDSLTNFCMNSGNTINGNADLLTYSGTTLSFKIGGLYPSLILTYADKTQEILTSSSNIEVLTNGVYTVLKEKGSNPILTNMAITEGKVFPATSTNGDYHCINSTELKSHKRVNDAWIDFQYVVLGTVTVAGNAITTVSTNQYNQNNYNVNFQTQGYRFPDYANGINKAWNIWYVAEFDGYVRAGGQGLMLSIKDPNGNYIPDGIGGGLYTGRIAQVNVDGILMVPIMKNYSYKAFGGTGLSILTFFPAKGV